MSTNDAFSEHIVNYFGSGDPFQVGNTTIPEHGRNRFTTGPRSPLTTFYNDFGRTEERNRVLRRSGSSTSMTD